MLSSGLTGQFPLQAHPSVDPLGARVTAGELGFTVWAVMPRAFGLPTGEVDAWIPARPLSRLRLGSGMEVPRTFKIIARLRESVTVEQARDDALRALAGLATTRAEATIRMRSLDEVLFGNVRPALNALAAAAALVLLVACGNVVMRRGTRHSRDPLRFRSGIPWFGCKRVLLLTSFLSARRAARVEPLELLRSE